MIQRPILFSTPMVQAILAGIKSQTRRIVKPQPSRDEDSGYKYWDNLMFDIHDDVLETMYMPDHCKFGEIGDILWVRETWMQPPEITFKMLKEGADTWNKYEYIADLSDMEVDQFKDWGWIKKPSIFMPKEACRIRLQIIDVRVERVQDISESDAKAEGSERGIYRVGPKYTEFHLELNHHASYKDGYKFIWENINGKDSWIKNPWVWVITFKKL